jgi:hypothetical protein
VVLIAMLGLGALGCPSASKPDPDQQPSADSPGPKPSASGADAAALPAEAGSPGATPPFDAGAVSTAQTDTLPPPTGKRAMWAAWPMPNPASTRLPNPAKYDIRSKGIVRDEVTGLMWQRTVDPKTFSWIQAGQACERLTLGGNRDWRLPSRIELASIVDLTHSQPSIDQRAFPHTPSDGFWTSSVDPVNRNGAAWDVNFSFGTQKTDPTNSVLRARCVRTVETKRPPKPGAKAEAAWFAPDYDVQTDTVLDRGTGLTWQRAAPAQTFSFAQAQQYCARLLVGQQEGWRTPTLGELLTLVDERTTNPTIDAKAFPKTPSASFWTSSPFAHTPGMAWHVYFEYGNALYGALKGPYHVRCVR